MEFGFTLLFKGLYHTAPLLSIQYFLLNSYLILVS